MSVTRDDAPLYLANYARRRAEPVGPLPDDVRSGDEPAFVLRARERSTLRALEELDRVTAPPGRTEEFARETVSPREQFPGEFRKRITTSIDVRLIRHGQTQDFESHSHHVLLQTMLLFGTKDFQEGLTSFMEKRPPVFPDKVSKNMPDFYPWWDEPGYS